MYALKSFWIQHLPLEYCMATTLRVVIKLVLSAYNRRIMNVKSGQEFEPNFSRQHIS